MDKKVIGLNGPLDAETLINQIATNNMWTAISALGVKPYWSQGLWHFEYGAAYGEGETIFDAAWDFYTGIL